MADILQIIGAILILSGFAASQLGWMSAKSGTYLVLNIAGATLLTWLALCGGEWGFFLLEGVWTVVSLIALVDVLLRQSRIAKASRCHDSDAVARAALDASCCSVARVAPSSSGGSSRMSAR